MAETGKLAQRTLRSPLGRVRGLGSAKEGAHHWWVQRLTAVALVPLTLWFIASLLVLTGASHGEVALWLARPHNAVLMLALIGATFWHGALGLQVVIEDYIHGEGVRVVTLLVMKAAMALLALFAALAVLKVAV
jgi:succinate dehydrogenase / fumarate reductase membrane anchor subunit